MNYSKLVRVNDSGEVAEPRKVTSAKNPLDSLKAEQSKKIVKKQRIEDSNLNLKRGIKRVQRVKDDDSEKLGKVLLDSLLSNYYFDRTDFNLTSLNAFIESNNYLEVPNFIVDIVLALTEGKQVNSELLDQYIEFIDGIESSLVNELDAEPVFEEKELEDSVKQTIKDKAAKTKKLLKKGTSLSKVFDCYQTDILNLVSQGYPYKKVLDFYRNILDSEESELAETELSESTEEGSEESDVKPVDELFDNLEVQTQQSESVIDFFTEALKEYADGDEEKLKILTEKSLFEEDSENHEDDSDENNEQDVEPEENEESLEDSIKRISGEILATGKAKVTDELVEKIPVLSNYTFDSPECDVYTEECEADPVTIPLTREEFCSLCPQGMTPAMETYLETQLASGCIPPPIKVNSITTHDGYIDVNQGMVYVPVGCTTEEFQERLDKAESSLEEIVSCAVPMKDAIKAAIMFDNLSYLDNRFYKKSISDNVWSFDKENRPACLKNAPEGTSIRLSSKGKSNFSMYGFNFVVE